MSTDNRQPTIRIRPASGWLGVQWRELWRHRDLWWMLAVRDIKVRYKQTVLGAAWAILQPLVTMLIFTLVFGVLMKVGRQTEVPYPVFAYTGLLPWTFFQGTVLAASMSLVESRQLMTKVYFPRVLVPMSVVGFTLLDLCLASVVLVGMMLWYGIVPGWGLVLLPVFGLGILACAQGVGILLSALTVRYRDFRYVVGFMVQLWMFATPVIYPASMVPDHLQWIYFINPMAGLVTGFRAALLGTPLDLWHITLSMAVALVALGVGMSYFRQVEDHFADIV